jgi:hypothetical protein
LTTSQKQKKTKDVFALTTFMGASVGTEAIQEVRAAALAAATQRLAAPASVSVMTQRTGTVAPTTAAGPPKKKQKTPKIQSKLQVMTKEGMAEIFQPYVLAKVAENNPLSDLLKPLFQAALIQNHPGIGDLLPKTVEAIYKDFIVGNAEKVKKELFAYLLRLPGDLSIVHDGVTILHESKQLYTISRGGMSVFHSFSDLGSLKHDSDAEVNDLLRVSYSVVDVIWFQLAPCLTHCASLFAGVCFGKVRFSWCLDCRPSR